MNKHVPLPSDVVKVPPSRCLACGLELNAVGHPGGSRGPRPGDLTICGRCGTIMKLSEDLRSEGLSDAEIAAIRANRQLVRELARWVQGVHLARHLLS